MTHRCLAPLFGMACAAPVAPAPTAVSPPAAVSVGTTATASAVPLLESGPRCTDGLDNDRDGLLDCEEASCGAAPGCLEICDNGLDDDDNGLADELDAPCWDTHSASLRVTASVLGGGAINRQWHFLNSDYNRGWVGNLMSSSSSAVSVASAWGTAQVSTTASGVFTCTWGASNIAFGHDYFNRFVWSSSFSRSTVSSSFRPVTRSLSWVDSGCPVTASAFLPDAIEASADGHFGARRSGSLVGRRWYLAAFPYFGGTFNISQTTASFGRFDRTEITSSVTGQLLPGDSAVLVY